jgi:hypothetical protein
MVVLGMFAGVFITGMLFPFLETFYNSTARGQLTLPALIHLPYGVVVLGVVLMALGGFRIAELLEKRSHASAPADG